MTNRERAPEAVCARTRFDWQVPPLETVTTGTFGLWCASRLPAATTLSGPPGRPAGDVVNAVPRGALRQPPLPPRRTETMDHMHINPSDAVVQRRGTLTTIPSRVFESLVRPWS